MNYEYATIQRVSRKTSGHECEELDEFLNHNARAGWRLVFFVAQTADHQLLIFEREKHESQSGPVGVST